MKEQKSEYTLRELCKLYGFSEAWVYKFEKYLGIRKWASNLSGKKSSYNLDQVRFFKKIHFLRSAQISLPVIKKLYDLEKQIIDIVRIDFSIDDEEATNKVGYVEVYLMEGMYGGTEGIEFNKKKYDRNKEVSRKMDNLTSEYKKLLREVHQRTCVFYKEIGESLKRIGVYTEE